MAARSNSDYPNRFPTNKINSWFSSLIWAARKPRIHFSTLCLPSSGGGGWDWSCWHIKTPNKQISVSWLIGSTEIPSPHRWMETAKCQHHPEPVYYLSESWNTERPGRLSEGPSLLPFGRLFARILTLCQEHQIQGWEGSRACGLHGSTLVLQVVVWDRISAFTSK